MICYYGHCPEPRTNGVPIIEPGCVIVPPAVRIPRKRYAPATSELEQQILTALGNARDLTAKDLKRKLRMSSTRFYEVMAGLRKAGRIMGVYDGRKVLYVQEGV